MYARGLTTREISEQIENIYGFEASAQLVSRVTDKLHPLIEEWQNRRLSEVYPIVQCPANPAVRQLGLSTLIHHNTIR